MLFLPGFSPTFKQILWKRGRKHHGLSPALTRVGSMFEGYDSNIFTNSLYICLLKDILDFFLATNGETGPRKSSKILVWTPNSYKLTRCEVNFQRFSSLIANHGRLCWQQISLRLFWWLPRMLVPLRALACCKSQWYFLKGYSPCCGGSLFYQTSWELTYPIKRQLGREVSFPIAGIIVISLEGKWFTSKRNHHSKVGWHD